MDNPFLVHKPCLNICAIKLPFFTLLSSSSFFLNNEFSSFQDEVLQHLPLLRESKGLVIGFNAVIRGIENNSLSVAIYASRKGNSALYQALNLMSKVKNVLLLQLQDMDSVVLNSKIPSSTTYGIKKSVIDQPQFSKLLNKINIARDSRKNQKEKAIEKICLKNEEICVESQLCYEDVKNENPLKNSEINCIIHSKHDNLTQKCNGKDGMLNFQEIDFPNYKVMFNQVSLSIR